jgi:hypothetical protein
MKDFDDIKMHGTTIKTHISNFMKIRSVGVELFQAEEGRTNGWTDGQTDTMKVIVAFRNFSNAPKIMHKFVDFPHHILFKVMEMIGILVRMA